ncbi:MAG: cytochrome c biogenesis protein CcsA [Bryobacteraceae bacterium]|nr:cytochrome c biogenesis protein CcsA [Bryobacteraceae bacterium]
MNDFSIIWLRVAAALYLVGLADSLLTLLRRESRVFQFALVAVQAAVVFHFVSIAEHTRALGHLPLGNFFDTASMGSFMFAVVFLLVYWRYKFVGLSLFVFPLAAVLSLAASMGAPMAPWANRQIRDVWLLVHIVLVLVGYSALLLSAGAALFYLVQERRLKKKARSWLGFLDSDRVPPLATLDTMITHSMSVGFVAITLAVIAGSTWASIELGVKWISEPKIAISLATWGFYLLMLCLRIAAGWRGRKAAFLALTVLGFCALTWAAHVGLRPLMVR